MVVVVVVVGGGGGGGGGGRGSLPLLDWPCQRMRGEESCCLRCHRSRHGIYLVGY